MSKVHRELNPLIDEACRSIKISRDWLEDGMLDWAGESAHFQMVARLATGLIEALRCYDGAMEDCDNAVEVLIARVKGDASLDSAGEWVRLNYPALARQHGLLPPRPSKDTQP